MTRSNDGQRWLFRATVADRAGAITSIAAAFSNRGISIDSVVAHGAEETPGGDGVVVVTFRSSEEEKEKVRREVERLPKVRRLDEHVYLQDYLRKGAVLLVKPEAAAFRIVEESPGVTCDLIKDESIGRTYFIAGAPNQVDPVIERLLSDGLLVDIVYAIMTL